MTTIYVISNDIDTNYHHSHYSDEDFIYKANKYGQVFTSLDEFTKAFNDKEVNTDTDAIRIITDDVSTDAIRIANAIKYIDNQETEVANMTDKDPHYVIGWLKQSIRIVKETLSPN